MKIKLKKLETVLSEEDYFIRDDGTIETSTQKIYPKMFHIFGKKDIFAKKDKRGYLLEEYDYWVNKRWVEKEIPDKEFVRMPELKEGDEYLAVRKNATVVADVFHDDNVDQRYRSNYNMYEKSESGMQAVQHDIDFDRLNRIFRKEAQDAWAEHGEDLDWDNGDQCKYCIYSYKIKSKRVGIIGCFRRKRGMVDAYFPTHSSISKSIEKHRKLIDKVFGE